MREKVNTRGWSLATAILATLSGLLVALSTIGHLGPVRSVLFSVWVAAAGGTLWYIQRRVERAYVTHWFDTWKYVKARQTPWDEIDALMNDEPLMHDSSFRLPIAKFLSGFLASLILALFFLSTRELIVSGDIGDHDPTVMIKWALPVGVLALIGTVLTVFYQVRLTARTENRKEWIKEIRGKMTALILLSDREYEPEKPRSSEIKEKITELELLLNPGKPLHRTFLTLVRTLHDIDNGFDKIVKSRLPATFPPKKDGKDSEPAGPDEWKARIVRLSNVILKYEWERVKHAE